MTTFLTTLLVGYTLLVAVLPPWQVNPARVDVLSKQFVQSFYDWYAPKSVDATQGPGWAVALRERRSNFTPELSRAIAADLAAQSKTSGEIVGLDFDPFLGSQDPCESYETGRVTQSRRAYSVEVFAICNGKRSERPDVLVVLSRQQNAWVFTNFSYPGGGDLLSVLKALRNQRRR